MVKQHFTKSTVVKFKNVTTMSVGEKGDRFFPNRYL